MKIYLLIKCSMSNIYCRAHIWERLDEDIFRGLINFAAILVPDIENC